MGSAPHQPFDWVHIPLNATTTTASLRLGHHLRIGLLLRSSFQKNLSRLCPVPRLKDLWCQRVNQLKGINYSQFTNGALNRNNTRDEGKSHLETSRRNSFNERQWTNILLAANILIYIAQIASQGKLMLWGAKINSLIDKGQFWRLATSSLLHANIAHLMVNCYSLNSIGPTVESICGPRRYLAVYFCSAIASSTTSYQFCKVPAVGASGAIFGLVGSLAVFIMRHRGMVEGGREELQHIAQVIFFNMAIGFIFKGIDNWGHLGGLLGGVAMSWFLGPAWKYESMSNDGSRIFTDQAPIFYFINRKRKPGKLN
ncbi:hypothetical protein Dsin_032149 [Dipteronia sinensis]|uniref:Peptidase S54 rhomboid domain-containing protein n=1 Tax=Dipteronia sinensis TaxID=43782 RepID=A0AAE0DSW7_9ROSI|nr:hypothetical protein Dsin_032149 [Dipteronia sinensis]